MNNGLLVDTNVLIYAIDADSIFHLKARELLLNPNYKFYTTNKNISEFLTVLTRSKSIKLDVIDVLKILKGLLSNFTILYSNKDTNLTFETLLKKYKPAGLKIHDFEIVSIALANGITHIATQNINDFKKIREISILTL